MGRQPLQFGTSPARATWPLPAVLTGLVVGWGILGGLSLGKHAQQEAPGGVHGGAGLGLILLALVQVAPCRIAWLTRSRSDALCLHQRPLFWRWMLAGPLVSYAVTLCFGARPGAVFVFWAALCAWQTLAIMPLHLPAARREELSGFLFRKKVAVLGWSALVLLVAPWGVEAALRFAGLLTGDSPAARFVARNLRLQPGRLVQGRAVNSQGYWDQPFLKSRTPGTLRVAVLGDGATLSGSVETNCLELLERRAGGVEVLNFGLAHAGPQEYSLILSSEVLAYKPDLVLAAISVGDDITRSVPLPGPLDWRSLSICQFGLPAPGGELTALPVPCATREEYLRDAAARLSVCRNRPTETNRTQWATALAHLEELARTCRRHDIPLGIVLLPAEFQVSDVVKSGAATASGLQAGEIDLELPQRRLATFAAEHRVECLDLLPPFRASAVYPFERNSTQWNEQGNQIAFEAMKDWLAGRIPPPQIAAEEPPGRR